MRHSAIAGTAARASYLEPDSADGNITLLKAARVSKPKNNEDDPAKIPHVPGAIRWGFTYLKLLTRSGRNDLPKNRAFACPNTCAEINGCKVYSVCNTDTYDRILLYIHGGSYVYSIMNVHLALIDTLAQKTNAKVVVPCYPLAPQNTFEPAYDLLTSVYTELRKEGKPITVMGDSAGGGLALGFAEYLRETGTCMPDKLALISPWADLSMTNDQIPAYEKNDRLLRSDELIRCGKAWAGKTGIEDYRVSPIYGNLQNLPETLLIAGTCECFYPDIMKLYRLMQTKRVPVHLVVGEEGGHAFPLGIDGQHELADAAVDILAAFVAEKQTEQHSDNAPQS